MAVVSQMTPKFNAALPRPDCGAVHDYDCRRYVFISAVAALWTAAPLLILIAALSGVIR
jgi:hypothetical protein